MPYPTKKLGEVLEKNGVIPAKIKRDDYRQSGKYPVIDQGENLIAGYIGDEQKLYRGDLPVVIFGDHTRILKYIDFPFAFGADGIKILRPQATLLPKFFYYVLVFNPVENQGYKRHFSLLTRIKIPLPPLEIQKQIVERLDKIAEAQKLNNDLIQKTDELFQSLLHKELNPAGKNWGVKKLAEVADFLDNLRKPVTASDRVPGPYPYYGANGQQDSVGGYIFNDELVLLAEDGGYFGSKTRPVAYRVSGKCWINNHAHVLKNKGEISDIDFLGYSLMYYDVTSYITGSTRAKLNKSAAEKIKISLPPLQTQKQIVAKLSAIQDYKKQLLEQKAKLKELFDSALAKAFK